jgi:hypothetical protein
MFYLATLFILSTEVTYLLINTGAVPSIVTTAQTPSLPVYAYEKRLVSPGWVLILRPCMAFCENGN